MPFIEVNQSKIYYTLSSQKSKSILLCIHGAGGSHLAWPLSFRQNKSINVICIDLPEHGSSSGSSFNKVESYSDFILSFIKKLGIKEKIHLCGHSMGGAITLDLSLRSTHKIDKLILLSTGAQLKVNPKIFKVLQENYDQFCKMSSQFMFYSESPQNLKSQSRKQLRQTKPEVLINDFKACQSFNLTDDIHKINSESLIICGDHDMMTPLKYSQFLNKEMKHSSLEIIDNTGHMPMLEKPDQFNSLVENFLLD